jgi:hypothetical protein
MMSNFRAVPFITGLAFWLLLALVAAVYWPALSGPFLFDDIPHLSALGAQGGVDDPESFLAYMSSGFSGPTGRPVALLSFLLDANYWPAPPRAFKYTNLCIHLLNGSMLFYLCIQLLRLRSGRSTLSTESLVAAFFAVAFWLIHPYLVSTTMYVVQRMAMLSTLFVFTGIAIWLRARIRVAIAPRQAYFWMTFALIVPGGLALLSKENGALLPVLVLVIEATIIRASSLPALNRQWKRLFLIGPSLIIVAYLVYYPFPNSWFDAYTNRDFAAFERLMTEARVILDYLGHWFVPDLYTQGLFHDDIVVSRGLWNPPRTAAAIAALVAAVIISLKNRAKFPLITMGVLFFLGSHLLESTTIALDLKFEHRMYLASSFLMLPISYHVLQIRDKRVVLALMSWENARVWSDYGSMTRVWAEQAPRSSRAQVESATTLYERGHEREALATINSAGDRLPDSFFVGVTRLLIQCRTVGAEKTLKADILRLAARTEYSPIWLPAMKNLMSWSNRAECRGLDPTYFARVVDALLSLEENRRRSSLGFSHLAYMQGVSDLRLGRGEQALAIFESSLGSRETPGRLMNMAAYLASYGYYERALAYARRTRQLLVNNEVTGRARADAPLLSDVNAFIDTVSRDLEQQ